VGGELAEGAPNDYIYRAFQKARQPCWSGKGPVGAGVCSTRPGPRPPQPAPGLRRPHLAAPPLTTLSRTGPRPTQPDDPGVEGRCDGSPGGGNDDPPRAAPHSRAWQVTDPPTAAGFTPARVDRLGGHSLRAETAHRVTAPNRFRRAQGDPIDQGHGHPRGSSRWDCVGWRCPNTDAPADRRLYRGDDPDLGEDLGPIMVALATASRSLSSELAAISPKPPPTKIGGP
jgi:hypothetical protein